MTWMTVFVSFGATLAVLVTGILFFFSFQKRHRRQLRKQLRKDELRCPTCFEQLYSLELGKIIGFSDGVLQDTLVCLNETAPCAAVGLKLIVTYRDPNLDRSLCGHRHPKLASRLPKDQVAKMRSARPH